MDAKSGLSENLFWFRLLASHLEASPLDPNVKPESERAYLNDEENGKKCSKLEHLTWNI